MRKLVVSTWMSLDGVFDADAMDQWYVPYDSVERQDYIREGILGSDALLLGRTTYEMLFPYWSTMKNNESERLQAVADKLNSMPKFVVSSKMKSASWSNSKIIAQNVVEEIIRLKQQPGHEIQIEGSSALVQSIAGAGLIDEYRLLVHPVITGRGQRFFKNDLRTTGLTLVQSRTLDLGVILLCYKPAQSS